MIPLILSSPDESAPPFSKYLSQCMNHWFKTHHDDSHENLYKRYLATVEPTLLISVLRHCDGNKSKAQRMLGIDRHTLDKHMKRYGISLSIENSNSHKQRLLRINIDQRNNAI